MQHELELAATDAGWLLGESTAASLGGLDQAQLARLASLVVIDSDGSMYGASCSLWCMNA